MTFQEKCDEALKTGKYKPLIEMCEDEELSRASGTPMLKLSDENLYTIQLISYLLDENTSDAFFLWKRLSRQVRKSSDALKATWAVARSLYHRDIPRTFEALKVAKEACGGKVIRPFFEKLSVTTTERTVRLVSISYTNVSLKFVARTFAIGEDEAESFCVKKLGWDLDKSTGILTPKKSSDASTDEDKRMSARGIEQLGHLTNCVNFLESKRTTDPSVLSAAANAVMTTNGRSGESA
eukprot:g4584.t1